MSCPGGTIYGAPPTVTATVDQSATITFLLDGTAVSSSTGISDSNTPGTDVAVGTHTIMVTASNANGKGSVTCTWTIYSTPIVQLINNCPQLTINGNSQEFNVSVTPNPSCSVNFYVGSSLVGSKEINSTNAGQSQSIFNSSPSIGYHPIVIEAINLAKSSSVSCDWYGTMGIGNGSQVS